MKVNWGFIETVVIPSTLFVLGIIGGIAYLVSLIIP